MSAPLEDLLADNAVRADAGLFYCPLPSVVHPEVDEVTGRSLEWLTKFGLCSTERQRRRLMATNSAEFFGRITPAAPTNRLQIAADWSYWGFAFDDACTYEDGSAKSPDETTALVARLLRVVETLDADLCKGDLYLTALHDIAVRYSRCATPVQMRRWVEAHRLWLFGHIQRQRLQARGVMPDLDAYLIMRLHDCGGPPVTAMIDVVNGIEVRSDEMDSPKIRTLTEAAWFIAGIDNERVSRAKEVQGEGAVHNIIDVVMHQRRCSLEQALGEVVAIRDQVMTLFLRLCEHALAGASPALSWYLTDLGHLIPGNVEWSLKTARYTTIYGAGAAKIGSVILNGGWSKKPADAPLAPLPVPSIAWWWQQLVAPGNPAQRE